MKESNVKKFKNMYLIINIPMICFLLVIAPVLIITKGDKVYYVGIISRIILGILCIFNGLWNWGTEYYSVFKTNLFMKINNHPKWVWWIVIIVGIVCLITAFMGYGYNGVKKPA
ncbi:hypothetical protein [Clostridium grantii]|nr:hypothetical protein [Clostridium grantii]